MNTHHLTDQEKESRNMLVFSYMTMRNYIGFAGMFLPVVLYYGTQHRGEDRVIEPSISDYYYTNTGDVLVAVLSMMAIFMFAYNGYGLAEKIWSKVAAIGALGVAFVPTLSKYTRESFSVHTPRTETIFFGEKMHVISAATFFLAVTIITWFFFPKTDVPRRLAGKLSPRTKKEKRNIIYRLCAGVMSTCILLLAVYTFSDLIQENLKDYPVIFILEVIAIEAFGIAWITKGETLWPEGEHYVMRGFRIVKEMFSGDNN